MTINSRNMQISILETSAENTIIALNDLPYLFTSRHLASRYVHVVIELLKMDNGL